MNSHAPILQEIAKRAYDWSNKLEKLRLSLHETADFIEKSLRYVITNYSCDVKTPVYSKDRL